MLRFLTAILICLIVISCDSTRILSVDGMAQKRVEKECTRIEMAVVYGLGPESAMNIYIDPRENVSVNFNNFLLLKGGESIPYQIDFFNRNGKVEGLDQNKFDIDSGLFVNLSYPRMTLSTDSLIFDFRSVFKCNSESIVEELVIVKGPPMPVKLYKE